MRHNLFQKKDEQSILADFIKDIKTQNRFAALASKLTPAELARKEEIQDAAKAAKKFATAISTIDTELNADSKRMEQRKQSEWLSMYGQAEPRKMKHGADTTDQTANEAEHTEKQRKRV